MNATRSTSRYTIDANYETPGGFIVWDTTTGSYLRDKDGNKRVFASRNAARKRISRERTGNFHK